MMQFVCTFSIMPAMRETYCYESDSKLWKNCTGYPVHQKQFRKWLVGGCIPQVPQPTLQIHPGHKPEVGIFLNGLKRSATKRKIFVKS